MAKEIFYLYTYTMLLRRLSTLSWVILLRLPHVTIAFKSGLDTSRSITDCRRALSSLKKTKRNMSLPNDTEQEFQLFGRFKIATSQIFYRSKHSFAMVNLRPLVPGHVLVVSNRVVPFLSDLECKFVRFWRG